MERRLSALDRVTARSPWARPVLIILILGTGCSAGVTAYFEARLGYPVAATGQVVMGFNLLAFWFLTNLRALGAQFALGFRIAMFVTALALGIVGMLQPVGSATVPGYWMSLALIAGGLVALSVAAGPIGDAIAGRIGPETPGSNTLQRLGDES